MCSGWLGTWVQASAWRDSESLWSWAWRRIRNARYVSQPGARLIDSRSAEKPRTPSGAPWHSERHAMTRNNLAESSRSRGGPTMQNEKSTGRAPESWSGEACWRSRRALRQTRTARGRAPPLRRVFRSLPPFPVSAPALASRSGGVRPARRGWQSGRRKPCSGSGPAPP